MRNDILIGLPVGSWLRIFKLYTKESESGNVRWIMWQQYYNQNMGFQGNTKYNLLFAQIGNSALKLP